jgi:hypothetical protein
MRVSTNVRRLNASEEFDVSAGEAKIREVVSVEGFIFNHYGQRFVRQAKDLGYARTITCDFGWLCNLKPVCSPCQFNHASDGWELHCHIACLGPRKRFRLTYFTWRG